MAAYEFQALNAKGKQESGIIEGDSERQVGQQLKDRALIPLSLKVVSEGKSATSLQTYRRHIRIGDLSLFTRQLATLISSGTPLEESLATISQQTEKKAVQRIVLGVRGKVIEGHSLADSMSQFPTVFPAMFRATVAAGEHSGHLDEILERLADYTEEHQATQQAILSKLIYPIILTLVCVAAIVALLVYVIPTFVDIFDNMGRDLPPLTQVLITMSEFLQNWGLIIGTVIGIGGFLFTLGYKRNSKMRYSVDKFNLRVPLFGNLIKGRQTAAFSRTLGILASSGVPIITALKHAGDVVTNMPMREAIRTATEKIREGASIAGSLKRSKLFPAMTVHLIGSGESSGNLEEMLERAADQQERETKNTVDAFVSLFEPILIVVMGVVIVTIVMSILSPILDFGDLLE